MTNTYHDNEQVPQGTSDGAALSRRQFIAGVGGIGIGAILGGSIVALVLPDQVYAIEASEGYLLIDSKKCGGCESCMLACSLVHDGRESLALSRIQISKNALAPYPYDTAQMQCRQCPYPPCVEACPVGAMHVDPETKVRMVDEGKCIGCELCVGACPFTPSRVQWNFEAKHAQKCDLCKNTPYWDHEGGPDGEQACVRVCAMNAISFTRTLPVQNDAGYEVNLRNENWSFLSYPIDDEGKEPAAVHWSKMNPSTTP